MLDIATILCSPFRETRDPGRAGENARFGAALSRPQNKSASPMPDMASGRSIYENEHQASSILLSVIALAASPPASAQTMKAVMTVTF
jgi:hypothetical protein